MAHKFSTAPFVWFGGKRTVVADVWARLGQPKQYIEPFCGSAAMLLGARLWAETIGPPGLRLELFAREHAPGWHSLGHDTGGDVAAGLRNFGA